MKPIFCVLLILGCSSSILAQQTTYGGSKSEYLNYDNNTAKVMIVSFEDKMYRSNVDRAIGNYNKMDQQQVQRQFQKAMPIKLAEQLGPNYSTLSFDYLGPDSAKYLSNFIHQSLSYQYELLNLEEEQLDDSSKSNVIDKLKVKKQMYRAKKADKGNNGIVNGQIVSRVSTEEKYMKAVIDNDTLLSFLQKSYDFDYIFFINELDFTYYVSNPEDAAFGGIQKELKTHYTIYNSSGKEVASGAKKTQFSNQENDIYTITEKYLPEVSEKIAKSFRRKVEQ